MKTKTFKLALLFLLMISLTACGKKAAETLDPCEVNGHKWLENTPNYQQPKTCEVCGATEGEPLEAFYKDEKFAGLDQETDMEQIIEGDPAKTIISKVWFDNYKVFDHDETHEAKEGYEWRSVDMHLAIGDDTKYPDGDCAEVNGVGEYYSDADFENDGKITVNYYGQDYVCEYVHTVLKEDINVTNPDYKKYGWSGEHTSTIEYNEAFLVPKGFDGMFVYFADGTELNQNNGDYEKVKHIVNFRLDGAVSVPAKTAASEESGNADAAKNGYLEDMVISTDLISLTVPEEFKGKFYGSVDGEMINIYDKACVDDGYPGFVFSVAVDKDKEFIPGGMYTKVGEFFTSDGDRYDVCRGYASEAQWDMEKYEDVPETYDKLEKAVDTMIESIKGVNDGTFVYKGGTKGEDLYFYLVSRYIDAYNEGWDASRYEEEGMSPEFYAMTKAEGEKALDRIGFAYRDVTNDGIDELLVGVISDSDEPSVVYDIYTVVDRNPVIAVSGTARNGYYALEHGGIVNFYSGGAGENGVISYIIEPNSTNLTLQFGLKCDTYTDEKNPWFICYDEDKWEAMTEEDYNSRYDSLKESFLKLDFTPLSDIAPIDYSKVDLSKYDTFTKMLDDFKKGMGYANIKLGDTDVFLASTGTYTGENDTENAIDSSIFMYSDGKIVYLGTISSIGTAYPLSVADGCIFTGGHHNVKKTTVKDGKLVTVEEAEEIFDTDGNSTYQYGNDKDGVKTVEDDSNLTRLFDEYEKAEPVAFSVEKR